MHVFRLGSKSVNYANKIIMQEGMTPDSSFAVSHQLMKNISLSNLSDAGTIQSNDDVEDVLRLRKYSSDMSQSFGNQFNYSYEHLEPRRKPSTDFRLDIKALKLQFADALPNRLLDAMKSVLVTPAPSHHRISDIFR